MKIESVVKDKLYTLVIKNYETNKNKIKACFGRFVEKRQQDLYDIAPASRIYFGQEDIDDFYNSLGITELEANEIIKGTYYYPISNFNPRAAKDAFTCTMLCLIRYSVLNNLSKEVEMYTAYLSFSGKFYPSIHYSSFPKVQPSEYRHVIDYVVNHELSGRYDIKKEGNIFKAVRSIGNTWYNTYNSKFKSFDDEDVVYLIQQLHNRIKSFMQNIAEIYYDVYAKKDTYLSYDSDSLSDDNYHLADNDSLKMERILEKTMTYMNNNRVNFSWCISSSDQYVRADEVKEIMTSILNDSVNIPNMRELIRCMLTIFFTQSDTKDINDPHFLALTIVPKPNTKDQYEIRKKDIVEKWLNENSAQYRKRRNRPTTASSYQKSVTKYVALCIYNVNK